MCGLVGMAGVNKVSHNKMLRDMWVFDTVRGFDSAGITHVPIDPKKDIITEKELGSCTNVWDWNMSEILNSRGVPDVPSICIIAHNRAATIGKVTVDNAHPFNYGDITGAHNGSLTSWYQLEGYKDLDVDSKGLFNDINVNGIDHTWKSFYGAAAITYWDDSKGTLNIIRNEQRPLYIAYSKDMKTLFWASEGWMINVAAGRHDVDLAPRIDNNGDKHPAVFSIATHQLHVFKPSVSGIELLEVRELEKKVHPNTVMDQIGKTIGKTPHSGSAFTKKQSINLGWGSGLPKGPKEVRGLDIKLLRAVNQSQGLKLSEKRYFIIGELPDGEIVHIYPSNMVDFFKLENLCKGNSTSYYKLLHRPRANPIQKGFKQSYSCSAESIKFGYSIVGKTISSEGKVKDNLISLNEARDAELAKAHEKAKNSSTPEPLFQYWNKGAITRTRWDELCDRMSPKQACLCCTSGLDINDHKDITWVSPKDAICPSCSEDPTVIEVMKDHFNAA